jgi:hypothetical protein
VFQDPTIDIMSLTNQSKNINQNINLVIDIMSLTNQSKKYKSSFENRKKNKE